MPPWTGGILALACSLGCGPTPQPVALEAAGLDHGHDQIGARVNARIEDCVAITEGVIRVRRRHENDMDFSKYNPFYWEGRRTTFRIEDHTPQGEHQIRFILDAEWPQDLSQYRAPDFSATYVGDPMAHETLRSKFRINARMQASRDGTHFEYVLTPESYGGTSAAFPELGEVLTIEFRFFNDESHAPWQAQKATNPHTISAYYSEFFRFVVGEAGLQIDDPDDAYALASPRRYAGGWTTTPTTRVEPWRALQQQPPNLTPANATPFLLGRTWFHTDLASGRHVEDGSDDKPSVFHADMEAARADYVGDRHNAVACHTCHVRNGSARVEWREETSRPVDTTIARVADPSRGGPHPIFGRQLQTQGPGREGALRLRRHQTHVERLDDGTEVTLSRPVFEVDAPHVDAPVAVSIRRPPALIGIGLLAAVPDEVLVALADRSDGQLSIVDGAIGRFGWKASQPTVKAQIEAALLDDMGVHTRRGQPLDGPNSRSGKAVFDPEALDLLTTYVSLLGVPPRRAPDDPSVRQGEALFFDLGCQGCHFPTLRTGEATHPELDHQTIHPYTDLLLHDMGEGLADGFPGPEARLWRTAPLWGLKDTRNASEAFLDRFSPGDTEITWDQPQAAAKGLTLQLLHDGRAATVEEAVLWHGGEAQVVVDAYRALTPAQRQALEAFVLDL